MVDHPPNCRRIRLADDWAGCIAQLFQNLILARRFDRYDQIPLLQATETAVDVLEQFPLWDPQEAGKPRSEDGSIVRIHDSIEVDASAVAVWMNPVSSPNSAWV